jgi:hypothetical protein
MEDLSEAERTQVMSALNAMSSRPQNVPTTVDNKTTPAPSPVANSKAKIEPKAAIAKAKPIAKNQKEVVIEIAALKGKGYPVAVNFDTGAGKPPALLAKKV